MQHPPATRPVAPHALSVLSRRNPGKLLKRLVEATERLKPRIVSNVDNLMISGDQQSLRVGDSMARNQADQGRTKSLAKERGSVIWMQVNGRRNVLQQ